MHRENLTDRLADCCARLKEHLTFIYPDVDHQQLALALMEIMKLRDYCVMPTPHRNYWDQTDNILITYGDTIVREGEVPLKTLKAFLDRYLQHSVKAVHILPFFPYSSDDGFSVIDYLSVNPSLGDWEDIGEIACTYKLMTDLVLNHMSNRSRWFDNYKKRIHPGRDYFIEADPNQDYSAVVRPRVSPLLTEYQTVEGPRYLWCTFSADQVDLNYKNPEVLKEIVNVMRHYMERGVKIFRMDAVAFLWKEVGTSCIHLQQTHEIIKLLRTLIEHRAPGTILVSETNVPNRENLTYFGNANEAHVIYNFSLPPLLLYTLLRGDCRHLKTWLMSMPPAQAGTAYLNFIASHDGIGLRPLDGLVSDRERENLIAVILRAGGKVTYRLTQEGTEQPYELNIALFSALKGTMENPDDGWQCPRFICAHAIMFALEGIPAIYIHSLLATENDYDLVEQTGRARSINRHIWRYEQLQNLLANEESHHGHVFNQLMFLLNIRNKQPAFHPNAMQFTLHLDTKVFAFWRQSSDRKQSIFCLNNITDREQQINLADINLTNTYNWQDLISGKMYEDQRGKITLMAYQSVWLANFTEAEHNNPLQ